MQVHPYITSQLAAARRAEMFTRARQQHVSQQAEAESAHSRSRVASRRHIRFAA